MGTTTESRIEVIGVVNAFLGTEAEVVGRNKEIKFPCSGMDRTCTKMAKVIDTCSFECYCYTCKNEAESTAPIYNSPRTGECCYGNQA